jgi:hypothetical protein
MPEKSGIDVAPRAPGSTEPTVGGTVCPTAGEEITATNIIIDKTQCRWCTFMAIDSLELP